MTATQRVNEADQEQVNLGRELAEYLQDMGARIEFDEEFERLYNLDFIMTRFEEVHAHVNLGVHVTTTFDDLRQMESHIQSARRGVVLKALYIEMSDATVDAGGLIVALGASLSFIFDRRWANTRAIGLRIHEDSTYNFFDLEETVERLQRMTQAEDLHIGETLSGRIIAYFTDKGFGFIQTDDERKFFFHIANIVDDTLRSRLPTYIPGEVIPVAFQYGGNDGKKYPKAINVSFPDEGDL
jgi:cold shock CspA family protein